MCCAQNEQDWVICFQCITAISPPSSHTFQGVKAVSAQHTGYLPAHTHPSTLQNVPVPGGCVSSSLGKLCLPAGVFASPHCSFALLQALGSDSNTQSLPALGSAREASGFCAKPARRNAPAVLCWVQGMQSSSPGSLGQEGRERQC